LKERNDGLRNKKDDAIYIYIYWRFRVCKH
jgi:hypothetical protein